MPIYKKVQIFLSASCILEFFIKFFCYWPNFQILHIYFLYSNFHIFNYYLQIFSCFWLSEFVCFLKFSYFSAFCLISNLSIYFKKMVLSSLLSLYLSPPLKPVSDIVWVPVREIYFTRISGRTLHSSGRLMTGV